MSFRRWAVGGMLLAAAVVVVGCSDPYAGRYEVSGTVTQVGKPLKEGQIEFRPVGDNNKDTPGGAGIADGAFRIPRDSGLKPGNYLVRITAGDGKTPNEEEAGGPSSTNIVSQDTIPEDWNVNSSHTVEVKSSGPNKFEFNIEKVREIKRKVKSR